MFKKMKTYPAIGLFFQSHLVLCFTSCAAEIHISFLPMLIFEIHMGFHPRENIKSILLVYTRLMMSDMTSVNNNKNIYVSYISIGRVLTGCREKNSFGISSFSERVGNLQCFQMRSAASLIDYEVSNVNYILYDV
jgi:hypothetical protein